MRFLNKLWLQIISLCIWFEDTDYKETKYWYFFYQTEIYSGHEEEKSEKNKEYNYNKLTVCCYSHV